MKHDKELNLAITSQFKERRKDLRLSLEDAGSRIGSSSSLIFRVEAGKASLDTLTQYADALGCHLELVPNNTETQAPADPQNLTDAERVELENLRRIVSIIKAAVK